MTNVMISFKDIVENSAELKRFFNMLADLIEKIEKIADKDCWHDEIFNDDKDVLVVDYADSNVDDAYWGGVDSGEVLLARELLTLLIGKTVAAKE